MAWRWDNGVQRYRNENGRFLSRETALIWAMDSMDAASDVTASLARLVANNEISADDWRDLMRQEIKDENIRQYLSTMGGREMMTQSDWGTVGNLIKEQYGYLENFYNSVQAGELSESAIAARAAMYMRAAREAHERGHAKGRGLPPNSLPGYPGDAKTVCLTNCGCTWRIVTVRNRQNEIIRWDCHWTLNPALENCPDCLERAGEWNPYVVSPPSGERDISKKRIRITLPDASLRRDVVALDIFSSPVE